MNALGRIITILLAIILILFLPLQFIAQSQVETIDHIVEAHTHEFTDSVRQKGSITLEDYEEYLNKINQTKELYNIEIEHATPKILSDLTLNIQEDTRLASNGLTIVPGINTIKVENSIFSLATHTHTEACYNGNLHVCEGINCEYENSNPTELLILTNAGVSTSINKWIYPSYLIYSSDGGVTWNRVLSSDNNLSDLTYAPDGGYFYIGNYTWNYSDYYQRVRKIIPSTKVVTENPYASLRYAKVNNYLDKIMYRNNLFFLFSASSGWLQYSTKENDRFYSTNLRLDSINTIFDIVYGNGKYIAIGNKSSGGNYYTITHTSTNGINWTPGTTINYRNYGKLIYANDRFYYGGGGSGTYNGYLQYSYDGINWTTINRPSVGYTRCSGVKDMAYGNGTLVILDTSGNIFSTKDNGLTYSLQTQSRFYSQTLKYIDGMFYLGGQQMKGSPNNGLYKSTDGINWTGINLPDLQVNYPHNYGYHETVYDVATNSVGDTGQIDRGSCLKEGKYYNISGNEIQPICNTVVTSIRAIYPSQTVDKGKPINTTAIATYLDGHEGEVSCSSNYNSNLGGPQTVTFTYSGKVNNAKTNGTKTCTINVIVIDKKVTSIIITPTSKIIERYQNPSFIVRARYEDGTSKIITNYTMSSFNNKNIGKQVVTFLYTENNVTVTSSVEVIVAKLKKICTECGTRYELDSNDIDNGCPNCASTITKIEAVPDLVTVNKGSSLPITVYAIYKNGGKSIVANWTSNYEPLRLGYQQVTISYGEFKTYITVQVKATTKSCAICGDEYQLNEDGSDPGCQLCKNVVVSIIAEPYLITIEKHQPLNLIVEATFRDGHMEEVTDWTTNFIPDRAGTFEAMICYKSASCPITVNVLDSNLIQCPYCGLQYSFPEFPFGCPVCSVTIIGIEASLRNEGSKVIKGSKLDVEILIEFKDTHKELEYSGYTISNYNPDILGEQTVNVYYKGNDAQLNIEVVDHLSKNTCPNGHVYILNEDGSDPGCPYCIDDGEREKIVVYYDIIYTTEIIEALYNQNIYKMKSGDYITIAVTKKNKSLRSQIIKILNFNKEIYNSVSYGGEVVDG